MAQLLLVLLSLTPCATPGSSDSSLFGLLHRVPFRNTGLTLRAHRYSWETVAVASGKMFYLEKENVSCTQCSWGGNHGTHRFLVSPPPPPSPPPNSRRGETGGVPPSGIRSAVPLGGISAGSVELRGDGSLSEWTIQNQSPAGAAKIGATPDALLALRLCGGVGGQTACAARLLQTHPQGAAAGVATLPPIDGLNYSGTFPVSRLVPVDATMDRATGLGLSTALFAYSSLAADDMEASARPAIAFTLTVRNAGPLEANASLLLNMPLQVETDQARPGIALGTAINVKDSAACAAACQANKECMSWNKRRRGSCQLQSSIGLNRYTQGNDAGVRGQWSVDSDGRCVTLNRPGDAPTSGQVSLCAADSSGTVVAHTELGTVLSVFGAGGSLSDTSSSGGGLHGTAAVGVNVPPGENRTISLTLGWRFPLRDWYNYDCDNAGGLDAKEDLGRQGNCTCKNATSGALVPLKKCPSNPRNHYCPATSAPHQCNPGCNLVTGCCNPPPLAGWSATTCGGRYDSGSTDLEEAKEKGNASFAYRNRYAEIFPTAREAAWLNTPSDSEDSTAMSTEELLIATVSNISAVHSVFMGEDSSLPDWLQDQLVNSISHVRDSYWFSNSSCPQCTRSVDPRTASNPVLWRQFEAFDCTDLDSIHNDGERHMPYIMLWPESERSKLAAWAKNQAPKGWKQEGMLAEQIHQNTPDTADGWTNKDTGSGRHMGDSSSAFVLEVLELHRWANDTTTLELYYETVKQIIHWQLKQSEKYGLPLKLETSYDILGFPEYELASYNSVFHIATLAAAAELADAMVDTAFAAACRVNKVKATAAFDALQWNSSKSAYDAGSDGCTPTGCDQGIGIFADSFYAQVLAYSAGLGTVVADPTRLLSHLKTQLAENCISVLNNENATAPVLQQGVCPNGIVALTGRIPNHGADLQVWEMAPPNHATLGLHLGQPAEEMLGVFEPSATSYSRRINDQWNIAGLKDTGGYPTATSHYGMHMVAWHIPLAISGQQANLPNSSLVFAPRLPAPYELPVLLPGVWGVLSSAAAGSYSLRLTVGELKLKLLAVDGHAAPGAIVRLVAGAPPLVWKRAGS